MPLPTNQQDKQRWRDQRSAVRLILWQHWDPIGINTDIPMNNEYDDYADKATSMARGGASIDQIAHYLTGVARDQIGIAGFQHSKSVEAAKSIADQFKD